MTGTLQNGQAQTGLPRAPGEHERLGRYAANVRLYRGIADEAGAAGGELVERRLPHNLLRPIATVAADWTVGPEIGWAVAGETDDETTKLTQAAVDIWDRSGRMAEFSEAVLTGLIYGDLAIVVRNQPGGPMLTYPDPAVCFPTFDPHDCRKLTGLTMRYRLAGGAEYSEDLDAGVAFWLANRPLRGESFGESEFAPVVDLVREYNHLRAKKTRIIDYYAKPTPVLEGVTNAPDFGSLNAVLKLPPGAKAYFLEWSGSQPDVEEHLAATRASICAISQTPPIAFAEVDRSFAGTSGVALQVLFGPLESKTARRRLSWGRELAAAMASAMRLAGHDVEAGQVSPVWQSAMPRAETEELENVEALGRIGLSRQNRLRRLGYDEDEIAANESQLGEERRQSADLALRSITRGPEV